MSISYTTLAGLKSYAKKIQREHKIPRHQALDVAARMGGFECYLHAIRHLPENTAATFPVTVLQHWWGYQSKEGGEAEVSIRLRKPLDELVRPHHLTGYLGSAKMRQEAVIERQGQQRHAEETQWFIARIARALQFMDATALKPSSASKCYPSGEWDSRPPLADHDHCWYDPAEKVHILMTEPYPGRRTLRDADQMAWESKHGWQTLQSSWGSIYGFGTELYLCCPASYAPVLQKKIERLEASPVAIDESDVVIKPWKPKYAIAG